MKRYMILSIDESVIDFPPKAIFANDEKEALTLYLKLIHSKDHIFRETVLDLSINLGFVERFILATDEEKKRFNRTGNFNTNSEVIADRIRSYFADRPDLGEKFICYVTSADRSLINDEVFEFIALNASENEHGLAVIDPGTLEVVA